MSAEAIFNHWRLANPSAFSSMTTIEGAPALSASGSGKSMCGKQTQEQASIPREAVVDLPG